VDDDLFEQRVAGNEVAFRKVNESLRAGTVLADAETRFPFCCECGRIGCSELIKLALSEYEEVRSDPRRFFVVDGHQIDSVEDVVATHDGWLVVEKRGQAGRIAENADPR
jgi:hypothetical protein